MWKIPGIDVVGLLWQTKLYAVQLCVNVSKTGKRCIDFVRWSYYTESDYGDKISNPH